MVDLLSNYDVSGAVQFFSIANEFAYIAKEINDLNANEYKEITRIKGDKLIKKLKQAKSRNNR